MKKVLILLLAFIGLVFMIGCNNISSSSMGGADSEDVTPPISEEIKGDIPDVEHILHQWSIPVCGERQTCTICGISNTFVVEHSTENGICEICGELYISKEIQIEEENSRHEEALKSLHSTYISSYNAYMDRAEYYEPYLVHTESYLNSRISALGTELANLKTQLSLAKLDNSASGKLKVQKLQSEINIKQTEHDNLVTERSYRSFYKQIMDNIDTLENQYEDDVEGENQLHKENISKIQAED